MYGEILKFV